jgi:transposase
MHSMMHSMTQDQPLVIGGVDSHADAHHFAALDQRGALLGTKRFLTTTPGYAQALDCLSSFGEIDTVAVESTGSYAAALVRYLREHDIAVVEVNQPDAHTRRRVGKSDPIDAEMAARLFQAGKATAVPKQTNGIVESIRLLRVARDSAVKSRTAATVQIRDLIITAPQPLRDHLADRKTLRGEATICARFRLSESNLSQPVHAAKFALRSLARRIETLDREIENLDQQLEPLVAAAHHAAARNLHRPCPTGPSKGASPRMNITDSAGQLLITAGENIDQLNGAASFAALCGSSPIPASSGKTIRHRLNPGGDRQANRALHLIAVCRLRYCDRTRAYVERRAREGKSQREIMRCLKRYIAREVYNTLRADLHGLGPQPPRSTTTILGGSPGFAITRRRT